MNSCFCLLAARRLQSCSFERVHRLFANERLAVQPSRQGQIIQTLAMGAAQPNGQVEALAQAVFQAVRGAGLLGGERLTVHDPLRSWTLTIQSPVSSLWSTGARWPI